MWSSTVPAAIDGLVAALQAAPDLVPAGVGLRDGPRVVAASTQEVVVVGFVGENDDSAVEGGLTVGGLATAPSREQFTIRCAASVLRGGGDITAARRRAYELLGVVGGVLAADVTLGGAVMSARLGETTLSQAQTEAGAVATVVFGVDCDAFAG